MQHQLTQQEKQQHQEKQQQKHQHQVTSAFFNYSKDMKKQNQWLYAPIKIQFYRLNQERKRQMFEKALEANQKFLNYITKYILEEEQKQFVPSEQTSSSNFSKMKTTLKQFYREWCSESKEKEDYIKIKDKCLQYLRKDDLILVPGCGLGRLVLELVEAGFGAQGNQVTYFMLFGSNFILNNTEQKEQYEIYPFIHSQCYYQEVEDIYRSVKVPDKVASEVVSGDANFSITAGQFTQVYNKQPSTFEAVTTCFFIDTANNIFDYIDTIHTCLKDQGIWINFGPLLYHYRQIYNEVSIEISWQTLKQYIQTKFLFIEQETFVSTTYCHDPKSQMAIVYRCISFVCRKKKT